MCDVSDGWMSVFVYCVVCIWSELCQGWWVRMCRKVCQGNGIETTMWEKAASWIEVKEVSGSGLKVKWMCEWRVSINMNICPDIVVCN